MPRVSQVQSLLVNLNHERELKCQKGKTGGQVVSSLSGREISETEGASGAGPPGSSSSPVGGSVFIQDSCL